jgi:hypothetical protein
MTASDVFLVANAVALIAWLVLAAGVVWQRPVWREQVAGRWFPLGFAAAYVVVIGFFSGKSEGGFDSLENVQILFRSPWTMVAGWIHYLAFDLFVGVWIAGRVIEERTPRWVLVVLLPLTFAFGPVGLLAHAVVRRLFVSRK